jgi:hypothetical protein
VLFCSPTAKVRVKENLRRLMQLYEATDRAEPAAAWNRELHHFQTAETGNLGICQRQFPNGLPAANHYH